MNTYSRILFVCTGNTCRGPMAATIMQQFVQDLGILTDSRGMVVLFPEPYNPKAVAVCAGHGMIMPSNSAAQLENTDFDNNTLVLVMNHSMKQKIYKSYDRAINVYTLGEFSGESDTEIADPYGKGIDGYNQCFEQLYVLVKKAAEVIRKNMEEEKDDSNRQ